MPKKFQGENSKSAVARARKAEKAAEEKFMKEKAAADEYWKDDDKLINKKFQRKEDRERKKQEDLQKRQERKLLEEAENEDTTPRVQSQKITVYQLQKRKDEEEIANKKVQNAERNKTHLDSPLIENLNRLDMNEISASGIDAAVEALSTNDNTPDKHPERRMAAAFRTFEDQRMPQLKKENPNMRLSQLKQLLRKEWQKSPQNPLNQKVLPYNIK